MEAKGKQQCPCQKGGERVFVSNALSCRRKEKKGSEWRKRARESDVRERHMHTHVHARIHTHTIERKGGWWPIRGEGGGSWKSGRQKALISPSTQRRLLQAKESAFLVFSVDFLDLWFEKLSRNNCEPFSSLGPDPHVLSQDTKEIHKDLLLSHGMC